MNVRALGEGDASAWWNIRLRALESEPFAFGKAAEEHRATTVESIAARFRDVAPGNIHLGAFDGNNLIGIATFLRETGLKEKHKGGIYGFYVIAEERRKGVGRTLLTALLEKARQDPSLEQILLTVATCQVAARQLYHDFGFQTYGMEPRALKIGSTYIDEAYMILLIS